MYNGKEQDVVIDMEVPKAYTPESILGTKQSRKTVNKGVGRDRSNIGILRRRSDNKMNENDSKGKNVAWDL